MKWVDLKKLIESHGATDSTEILVHSTYIRGHENTGAVSVSSHGEGLLLSGETSPIEYPELGGR